ncbi:MAG: DUF4827 domain-containing protein [Prevotella sp.]|nr:DUF4827 domain-containing protein [Prevotella sp.]
MRNIFGCLLAVCASFLMSACHDTETYADQKDRERAAINKFIADQGIKVISESDFKRDTLTDVSKKEFVLFSNTGVYMQIVRRGCGEKVKSGETVNVLCRFNEYNLLADSLRLTNNNMSYSSLPDKFAVTNTLGTFTASFISGAIMSTYSTTSVPAGWLIPLSYINVGRVTKEGEEIAKVNLIVPHSQGTSYALSQVYPCYYEITYERGI